METFIKIFLIAIFVHFFIGTILNLIIRFINKNYNNLKNSKRRKDKILYFNIRKWRIKCLWVGIFEAKHVFASLKRYLEFRKYLKNENQKIPV